jgi:hypothetical protein
MNNTKIELNFCSIFMLKKKKKKKQVTAHAGEDTGKWENFFVAGQIANLYNHPENWN